MSNDDPSAEGPYKFLLSADPDYLPDEFKSLSWRLPSLGGYHIYVDYDKEVPSLGASTLTLKFDKNGDVYDTDIQFSGGLGLSAFGVEEEIRFSIDGSYVGISGLINTTVAKEDLHTQLSEYFETNYPDLWLDADFRAQLEAISNGVLFVQSGLYAAEIEVRSKLRTVPELLELVDFKEESRCFAPGTHIALPEGTIRPIESIRPGDVVQSYDAAGRLVLGRVTRVFTNEVAHILDVHGLMVTPGHVTLCGDGVHRGRHVPIIDILLTDGALVREDGSLVRIATNAPVGSEADAMVRVLYALTPEEAGSGVLYEGEMRAGTLLFDREGEPVSVLDCLRAEGLAFDPETGLVARDGQVPEPLRWFGPLPRPEDYVLRRSRETREAVLGSGEWEGMRPAALGRLQ